MAASPKMSGDAKGALIAALVVAVIVSAINNDMVVLAVTPIVLGLVIFAMSRIPLRQSMQGVMLTWAVRLRG